MRNDEGHENIGSIVLSVLLISSTVVVAAMIVAAEIVVGARP